MSNARVAEQLASGEGERLRNAMQEQTLLIEAAIPAKGGTGLNTYQYQNAEVDRLLDEARAVPDAAARIAISSLRRFRPM